MDKIVPLISTRTVGPIGLAHLPRLWLKLRLAAAGKLAEGYRSGEGGFDGLLLEHLGISSDTISEYVSTSQPDYLTFEAWIKETANPDSLTSDAIEQFNTRILSFPKPEPGRTEMLTDLGIPDSGEEWLGTDINDLDDWLCFHKALSQAK